MRPKERDDAYAAIDGERDHQIAKWGPSDNDRHPISGWLCVLRGELDEAFYEWQKGGNLEALHEIRQVAAVAVACLEQHGAPHRDSASSGEVA